MSELTNRGDTDSRFLMPSFVPGFIKGENPYSKKSADAVPLPQKMSFTPGYLKGERKEISAWMNANLSPEQKTSLQNQLNNFYVNFYTTGSLKGQQDKVQAWLKNNIPGEDDQDYINEKTA